MAKGKGKGKCTGEKGIKVQINCSGVKPEHFACAELLGEALRSMEMDRFDAPTPVLPLEASPVLP